MMMPEDIAPNIPKSNGRSDRALVEIGGIVLVLLASLGLSGDAPLWPLLCLYVASLAAALR